MGLTFCCLEHKVHLSVREFKTTYSGVEIHIAKSIEIVLVRLVIPQILVKSVISVCTLETYHLPNLDYPLTLRRLETRRMVLKYPCQDMSTLAE
jgi:hypothetical protein